MSDSLWPPWIVACHFPVSWKLFCVLCMPYVLTHLGIKIFPQGRYNSYMHLRRLKKSKKKQVKSLSHVRGFAAPWTVAYQVPPSMRFSRQENWSGLPFPSPGDLPDPGIEPRSPALSADALPSEPPGESLWRTEVTQSACSYPPRYEHRWTERSLHLPLPASCIWRMLAIMTFILVNELCQCSN